MRFRIRHATSYRYDRPVALGPHLFRLRPREDAFLRLEDFRVSLYPPPVETSAYADFEGNPVTSATFDGETQEFRVLVESAGETVPFSAPESGVARFPLDYAGTAADSWLAAPPPGPGVSALAASVAEQIGAANDSVPDFLAALSLRMHASLRDVSRLDGPPLDPEATLRAGAGSCRDFAVLFMACCRLRGVAARFVSGYVPAAPGERQHMHAWAEALLPGFGWVPYDPARGGLAGEGHVPVAAAAASEGATPVEGAYTVRGGPAQSVMSVELRVETSP